ncbi:MAG: acyl-CoA dehydrogenase family protein [Pseudomonadota bacterium]
MQFEPSSEVQETLASLDRYLERNWSLLSTGDQPGVRQKWRDIADMGVLGMCLPQTYGGFGLDADSFVHVSITLGRKHCHLPYISTAVCCATALCTGATEEQKQRWLPPLIEGKHCWALAYQEANDAQEIGTCQTCATFEGGKWVLNGTKTLVMDGIHADYFLVAARISVDGDAEMQLGKQPSLFVVSKESAGLSTKNYRTIDNRCATTLGLNNVLVEKSNMLGQPGGADNSLDSALSAGCTALSGETVGLMEHLLGLTTEYLKTRKQFGQALGKFQVMQHAAADMYVALEQMKSLSLYAALLQNTNQADQAASAAKIYAGTSGRAFAKKAIQLHGGMGLVNEMPAAHYAKRLAMMDCWLGDSSYHLNRHQSFGGAA